MASKAKAVQQQPQLSDVEVREWLESLDYVIQQGGAEQVTQLLHKLQIHAQQAGITLPFTANTPYINTIPATQQPVFPGSREIERRIKSLVRWNALSMVVRANREESGIGGHISTYASAATLYEVGFNHFFRARDSEGNGDIIYFQGHAAPGIYARAFLEGRLSDEHLQNFRRELRSEHSLSSYPHPWLMPDFWEFPTVSMGLGPIMAIYQARFCRYLEDRGLKQPCDSKVWAFLGDGEIVDGQWQKYSAESGAYFREHFFGTDPRLLAMVKHLSDEQLARLRLGGHDPQKVYAAYKAAVEHKGSPTVILARTIKGYGLGEAGEGKNITHQQKKLNEDELRRFRSRFGIPIPDEELHDAPFYRPADDSPEIRYMQERRKQLGGYLPERKVRAKPIASVSESHFEEFYKGTDGREVSTTMVFVRLLS